MAIVSIHRPQQERREAKVDPMDKIIKGLQIASSVYGFKTSYEQSQVNQLRIKQGEQQIEQTERQEQGILTPLEASKAGLAEVPEGTSGARQFTIKSGEDSKTGYYVPRSQLTAQSAAAAKASARGLKADQRLEDIEFKLTDRIIDFQKEKKTKDLSDKYNSATRVEALIGLNNPIADAIAKRNLFRISGDVGVIRAEDLRELGSDPSLPQRAQLAIDTMIKGEAITTSARNDIREATTVLKTIADRELQRFGEQRAQVIAGGFRDFDRDDVLQRMNLRDVLISNDEIQELLQQASRKQVAGSTSLPGESQATAAPQEESTDVFLDRWLQKPTGTQAPLLPRR